MARVLKPGKACFDPCQLHQFSPNLRASPVRTMPSSLAHTPWMPGMMKLPRYLCWKMPPIIPGDSKKTLELFRWDLLKQKTMGKPWENPRKTMGKWRFTLWQFVTWPLKITIDSVFSTKKLWFSIAMLDYRRVSPLQKKRRMDRMLSCSMLFLGTL